MTIRNEVICDSDLGNLYDIFYNSVIKGYAYFWEHFGEHAYFLTIHTRARIIRDRVAQELRMSLSGKSEVNIVEKNQTTYFCIGKNWAIIVHKIHENGTVAINKTNLSINFNDNDRQDDLPYIPSKATVLHLGYTETVPANEPQVRLACPNGESPAWVKEIKPSAPPEPVIDITPVEPDAPRRVRVIKKRTDKESL